MSENIVSAVSRFLTPELVGKIASASGIDRSTAQSAVGACVPAILSGLSDLASKPGGARQLADAIAEQPAGLLNNLAATLGGSAQSAEKGGGLLASLLGGGVLNTLVSTLGRFIGIGEGSTRTLMGLLTPVVLGVLGREQRAAGLEAGGLARMLMGQKDQFSAAMPSGLSDLLGSKGRMPEGDISRTETRTYDAPQPAATYSRASPTSVHRASVEPTRTGGSWAYWLLPLLALGGLLWYLLPSGQTPETRTAGQPTQLVPSTPGKLTYLTRASPDWMPIGAYYNQEIYNRTGERIGSIKDLLVGPDGRIHAAVVGVGGYLGIGEKDIAVPLSVLHMDRDGRRITIDVMRDTLQAAPAFEHGERIRLRP